MKRIVLLPFLAILLLLPSLTFPISRDDLNKLFDLNITIKTLDLSLRENRTEKIDKSKFVLLNGAVSSIIVLNSKRDSYEVVLEIISGEWIGTEDVRSYRVYVDFKGSKYYSMIPRRKPRHPKGNEILRNTGVMIIARILQPVIPPGAQSENDKAWFLEGIYIRKIY